MGHGYGLQPAPPEVVVPADTEMATEPARAIAHIRSIIAFVIALCAIVGIRFAPELPDQLDQLVTIATPLIGAGLLWWNARKQGELTREAVYPPAAAASLAEAPPENVTVRFQ